MSLETVRLSQREKEQLQRVKRDTGIKNWNILCRWALCLSLAENTEPILAEIPADSNVEMTWKTFGGADSDVFEALIRWRLRATDETGETRDADYVRAHLHRGIGYLFGNRQIRALPELIAAAVREDS